MHCLAVMVSYFFFNTTATTDIYTLSLHDALPIWCVENTRSGRDGDRARTPVPMAVNSCALLPRLLCDRRTPTMPSAPINDRSEEHTSELQSRQYLVCRLLLEKKKEEKDKPHMHTE